MAAVRTSTANVLRAVAFATAVLLLATACGGSSATYVVNKPAQTYFKVPKNWDVVPIVAPQDDQFLRGTSWARFFAPEGLPPDVINDPSKSLEPVGMATIGQIEQGVYDQFSDVQLRAIVFTIAGEQQYVDPVDLINSQDDDFIRLLAFEAVRQDGLRGYRLRYQIRQEDPLLPPLVWEQTKLVHDNTHTYYSVKVVCQIDCFVKFRSDIATIFDSLRVRRDQP
ncbi:MAG: hypothetical protein ABI658_16885 [Acidimicrobiales bacterium]